MNMEVDMARLRSVLAVTDKQTQHFLQPLLPLRGVQELLLTFVRDASRSFEDWVWDPKVRQTLENMRDVEPQAHAQGQHLDQWYSRAAEERLQALVLQNPDDETPPQFLEEANAAQIDGRGKFKQKNYYAAQNAFVKSIEAVLKHQESEYYGKIVPAAEWDDMAIQERYVTLCNNVAICGIKMKDLSLINEYTAKALAVDESSTKALYAMVKLRLMEHRFEEAGAVVDRALGFYPDKVQFLNLKKEIEAAERKQALKQAELSEIRAKQVKEAIAAGRGSSAPAQTQEEAEQQMKKEMQRRVDSIALPTREDDTFAAARLNVYFMKIKQRMMVDIHPRHNADAGEEPLFECTIVNGATGDVLAASVQGISKKVVKNDACKIAIEKLWNDKQEAGKLTAEDSAYLERFERAKASGQPLVTEPVTPTAPQRIADDSPQLPTRISWMERQLQPLPLLNQLTQRGTLHARFDIEDVSPNREVTEFECTGFLNGEQIAVANAISKKKARTEVAGQVLAAAFEKNLLVVYDGPAVEENENAAGDAEDQDGNAQTPAFGG
uniref:DRBM domain-containing protein n=1 Tax=Phytophthora ramorum TaxID=164328 RepID=H3GP43_PHYRM